DLTDDLVKVVRLHGEHDDILFAGLRRLLNGSHLRRFYLAVVPFKLEAVLLHRGKMRALVDDGHLVAGERELGGHQSADGAGADDADLLRFGQRAEEIRAWEDLIEGVGELADTLDNDVHRVVRAGHYAGAERRTASDHVSGQQRHVF